MSDIFDDLSWAWRMLKIRRTRRKLLFSSRSMYDQELRPSIGSGTIAYPDAFYYIQAHDVDRANANVIQRHAWKFS